MTFDTAETKPMLYDVREYERKKNKKYYGKFRKRGD